MFALHYSKFITFKLKHATTSTFDHLQKTLPGYLGMVRKFHLNRPKVCLVKKYKIYHASSVGRFINSKLLIKAANLWTLS